MRHAQRVLACLESDQAAATSRLAASWRRSYERHGIDPFRRAPQHVATSSELRERKQKADQFLSVAGPMLDNLFSLVGASGCSVVLTDADGFVLEQRCRNADARSFQNWGLCQGAVWSEDFEGTNGIGTCLAERRAVTIHRDQHYLPKNIAMTCIGVPIHGAKGKLIGVLDVSSARSDQTNAVNKLIAATVKDAALKIETENFRAHFPNKRVVLAGHGDVDQGALVAISSDDCIVGATRAARKLFNWELEHDLKPVAATDIFEEDKGVSGFVRGEKAAIIKAITRANGNVSAAAKSLGIGRATLYRRMNRLGIARSDERRKILK
ncbi:MAG: GAF domain-containing protein [Pseudomonadota bacterium]